MRALSIRQPYAELILRGSKRIEYRSRPTRIIGERFYIYAAKKPAAESLRGWSRDLASGMPPPWIVELADALELFPPRRPLPTGVIVGSAVIEKVSRGDGFYRWHLCDVRRARTLRRPTRHPQPVWFEPF